VGSGWLVTGVQVPEVRPCGSGAGRLRTCGSFSRGRRVWLALGLLSGGSLWWTRWRLAAGATVWVLVGSPGCVGSGMSCVGGIRGVGVFVLLPRSWRPLPQSTLISPLRLCEVLWLGISWMVVCIRAKALPDMVGASDVDALERRFPPWRRHGESCPSTIGSG
jgi:hypothetical protein